MIFRKVSLGENFIFISFSSLILKFNSKTKIPKKINWERCLEIKGKYFFKVSIIAISSSSYQCINNCPYPVEICVIFPMYRHPIRWLYPTRKWKCWMNHKKKIGSKYSKHRKKGNLKYRDKNATRMLLTVTSLLKIQFWMTGKICGARCVSMLWPSSHRT